MGFDPRRQHKRRPSDILYVGAATVVFIGLIAWMFLG